MVSDDENSQEASGDAFDALYFLLEKRLARGLLTVVDATNVRPDDRKRLVQIARKFHCFAVAIVIDTPERICQERNASRPDRQFGSHVVHRHIGDLRRGLRGMEREGFRYVHIVRPDDEIEIRRTPLWNNKKSETGPFDIVGDIHGCAAELRTLLLNLGWQSIPLHPPDETWGTETWEHPEGRKAIFLGDLVDRGPQIVDAVRIVRNMVHRGVAFCVAGNHDVKLVRWAKGKNVQVRHGLEQSIAELESFSANQKTGFISFLDRLVSHYVLDEGRLVVAHAGLREEMHGRGSGAVRDFCLFGETTGETDEFGLPVRYNWAGEYRGKATVVYGHTPVPEPEWLNNTVNIDTGAVFGGRLTALRYPEREFVSVPAERQYVEPVRPFASPDPGQRKGQQELDDVLDIEDITGRRIIETRLRGNVSIREGNSIAALEIMSRFATDPRWLIYLPPTMSPTETSAREDLLEYPTEAFAYYAANKVERVICQQKHMGSRAIVVVCRDSAAARERFGVTDGRSGVCYTRTGRPFFSKAEEESAFVDRVRAAIDRAGFWDEFQSSWFCLDCELMPWSAKARSLIEQQYAPVGAAGIASLTASLAALRACPVASELVPNYERRLARLQRYREAYQRYCWSVTSLDDYKLAPFHLMASENRVYSDCSNRWHMETLGRFADADPGFLLATPWLEVALADAESIAAATRWWDDLTGSGGEGMVVKPMGFIATGAKGTLQPALKCRGREYLRIIYGPEYTADNQLPRLRSRSVSGKRSLALREFALGIEALERFVRKEPLRRVHQCVFGILAMESEPVDPRL